MALDVTRAIISLLKFDSTLAALVGETEDGRTRIYGEELPPASSKLKRGKAVVVRRVAGVGGRGGYLELESGIVSIMAYGETHYEADEVRRAAHAALKQAGRQVQNGVLLHGFSPASGVESLKDPDTQQPVAVETWQFLASEVEAV